MRKRLVGKLCLAVALSSALVGAGVTAMTATKAEAAIQKKHPPKHKKKKKKKKASAASASKKLKALASGVASEKGATFEVVYTTTSSGQTESVTFAQSPPKYLIKVGTGGSVIYTGSETLYCETTTECISTGTANPIAPIEHLFSPTTAKAFFDEAEVEVATKEAGYSVSFSSGSYGGLSSECATVSGHGNTGKYCVARNGVLTYAGSASGSITLTSYTSNVPSTAFSPPSGATIITEPTT
jgi:hypothetical protein